MGRVNFPLESQIHVFPKTWEKWIPMLQEKYAKTHISKLWISYTLTQVEIHTISKLWVESIPILRNKYGKRQTIPRFCPTLQI